MVNKNPTIKDVANLSGVSISSVSRYLKDPKSIKPIAAYKIKCAIRELNYEPNIFASNLKKGHSNIIGIVVPHMEYFFGKVTNVISDYFYERGYITFICESDSDQAKEKFYIQELLRQRAAGIIIAPCGQNTDYLRSILNEYHNVICIDRLEDIGASIVLEDHKRNSYDLLLKSIEDNRDASKILLLFGWKDSYNTRLCENGADLAVEDTNFKGEVIKVYTARKLELINKALDELNKTLKDGEKAIIISYGSDILEYLAIGLHAIYKELLPRVVLGGFAQKGTSEKLNLKINLIIKQPESVAILAAKLLYDKLNNRQVDDKVYEIKIEKNF